MSRRPILLLLLLALPAILHAIPPPKKKSKPATTPPAAETQPAPAPPKEPAPPPVPAPAPAPVPVPVPASPAPAPETPAPPAAATGTQCQWLGLHYIYLVTRSGVRLAINPFPPELSGMPEPRALPADIVLISSEAAELSGGRELEGLPRIYRSLAGTGQHNANGIPITGIETYRDDNRGKTQGHNTVFVFTIDGMRFCHLGSLGHPLDTKQRRAIGRIDVLFLPIGSPMLETRQWLDAAAALSARWIVPVAFDVTESPKRNYRLLQDLSFGTLPVQKADASSFTFRAGELPATPTVLLLQHP